MSEASPILRQYPLSPQQQGMFFEWQRQGGRALHLEQSVWRVEGPLDPARFRQAWQELADRHPALRCCFGWGDGREPVQYELRPHALPFEERRPAPGTPAEEAVEACLADHARAGMALNRPPLMRFSLVRESSDRHYLVWTHHHILLDGWSVRLLAEELMERYRGRPARPAPPSYQGYLDWLGMQDRQGAEAFWSGLFNGAASATVPGRSLPGLHAPTEGDLRREIELTAEQTLGLREAARRAGGTLNHLLKAAWAGLLATWNPDSAVCYGVTVSGRPHRLEASERMVGLFIQSLPERIPAEQDDTVGDLIARIQEQEYRREEHEWCGTGQVHRWSGLPGSEPLFRSLLVFDDHAAEPADGDGEMALRFEPRWYRGGRTALPLTLLFNASHTLSASLLANPRHFSAEACDRTGEALRALLRLISRGGAGLPLSGLAEAAGAPPAVRLPVRPSRRGAGNAAASQADPLMREIWAEVLGMEEIPDGADFFELGGHSLLAMRMANRIRDRYKVDLPLRSLFQHATLEEMSRSVRSIARSMQRIAGPGEAPGENAMEEGEL